jgi:hypothetical protein
MHSTTPSASAWWSRNWKWCVPVLGTSVLALFLAFLIGLVALLLGAMKASGPYRYAVERAQNDPAVVAALGAPIEPGWFVQGNVSVSGAGGAADLAIPLRGTRTRGTVYVVAGKRAGEWRYQTVAVNVHGGQRIVLEEKKPLSSP